MAENESRKLLQLPQVTSHRPMKIQRSIASVELLTTSPSKCQQTTSNFLVVGYIGVFHTSFIGQCWWRAAKVRKLPSWCVSCLLVLGIAEEWQKPKYRLVISTAGQALLQRNVGQVTHTHMPLSSNSIIWYWLNGGDVLWLRRYYHGPDKK